ncbi:MFS transporter [Glycomyces algeriensis]|uniref:MFS transporter n=1 Tax=Glycomyces algeriensis TaxID=256037 RepID=A0A9W6G7H0_9ACTN|nr:MFS transporter [Glycomyces algeriensis]MDA1366182.1 MFS transporter [Glycomyces algeriensis]MDR7349050.1 EmrB/QacA subfamily drug resistance transporter [Glycomyces algeriensis]GLI41752.1 MFS transporter [Glycomyces algeriensis]
MSDTRSEPTPAEVEDQGHPRRWAILGVLVISLIVVVLDNTVLNVAMKTLAAPAPEGVGASQSDLAWMINSYTLVFAGLLFASGIIGDRLGRKRMLLAGLAVFGVASLLSAYSTTPDQLIWYRALMGAGAAIMMPSTLSLLRNIFSAKEFPKALGIWTGAVGIGGAIGPIVGGSLLEHFWWGSVFLINVPIVIFGIIAVAVLAPESKGSQAKADFIGMALSMIGLVSLTYGIIEAGDAGSWSGIAVWGTIGLGVLVLVAFVLWEKRIPHASLDMKLFKNTRFSASSAIITLTFFGMMGLMFFMTFYLQILKGYSPLETGLLFLPFGASMLIFAPLSNTLVQKFGAKTVGIVAMLLVITNFTVTATVFEADTSVWVVIVLFLITGAGMANLMPPAMNTLMSSVPREKAGVGSALANTLRQVGGALGVAVLGTVMAQSYQSLMGDAVPQLDADASESYAATYGVLESGALPPEAAGAVQSAADASFIDALHTTAFVAIGVALVGLIIIALFFPGRQRRETETPERAAEPALVEA